MTPAELSHPFTQLAVRIHGAARIGMDLRCINVPDAMRVIEVDGVPWSVFVRELGFLRPNAAAHLCMSLVPWSKAHGWDIPERDEGECAHPCILPLGHRNSHSPDPCTPVVPNAQ